MTKDKTETGPQREYADRRQQRAVPDAEGLVHAEGYDGPDRRSYRARREERIRKEKIAIFNRTTLSVGLLAAAVLYAIVFLLAPELREMNENEQRVREMTARMNALAGPAAHPLPAPEAEPSSSVGGTLSRQIGAVGEVVGQATETVRGVASAVASVAAPGADVEDLLHLLTTVQGLGRTPDGRARLEGAVGKLRDAARVAGDDPANLNAAISVARSQDPTLNTLFGRIDDGHLSAAVLLLSLDDLRRRAARGLPFADDLALAAAVTGNNKAVRIALAGLIPYADSGVAARGALIRQLALLSSSVQTTVLAGNDGSLTGDAMRRLSPYVRVRKTEDSAGDGPVAALARAQAALNGGDVRAALGEVKTLDGPHAEAAAPWVAAAQGHVAADESADLLSHIILQTLTAAASGGGFSVEGMVGALSSSFPPGQNGSEVLYVSPAMLDKDADGGGLQSFGPTR